MQRLVVVAKDVLALGQGVGGGGRARRRIRIGERIQPGLQPGNGEVTDRVHPRLSWHVMSRQREAIAARPALRSMVRSASKH